MKYLVILDDGHGIDTSGKCTPDGYKENNFNRAVVENLRQLFLSKDEYDVFLTSIEKHDVPLPTRVDRANEAYKTFKAKYPEGKCVLISVHYNAFKGVWGEHGGISTFYNTKVDKALAQCIHTNIIQGVPLRDRGLEQAKFTILTAEMPSCLVECGFMDNKEEAKLMQDENYIKECAVEIMMGIREYFKDKPAKVVTPEYNLNNGLMVKLKKEDISRIEYIHGLEPTERIDAAYKRIGCDIIINANFYSMSDGASVGKLWDEGVKLSEYALSEYGYGFNGKDLPVFDRMNSKNNKDFVGGHPSLLIDGETYIDTNEYGFNASSTIKRGRTCIGDTFDNELVIRCIPDSIRYTRYSISGMARVMKNNGCKNAVNLDGGGSTQYITPWGKYISGRPVDGFICVWLKKSEQTSDVEHKEHIVKAGETLSTIAKKYNTTYQKIAVDNGITNFNSIKVGQKLKIV